MPEPTSEQQQALNQTQAQQQAGNPPDAAAIEAALLQKVFGGKYKTSDEAARGHWELNQHAANAMRLLEERDNPAHLASQRPDPLQRLKDEAYIPPDAFRDAVTSVVGPLLQDAFRPIMGSLVARDELSTEFPAYIANEPAIRGWLKNNPQIAAEVQALEAAGLYKQAAKLSTLQWQVANPPASPGNKEQQLQAALQTTAANASRTQETVPTQDQLMMAIQYGHRTGDKRAAYAMLFPEFEPILPPHLQQQR